MKKNPNVKKGDTLLVITGNNSNSALEGKVVTVVKERVGTSNSIKVKTEEGQTGMLYYSRPADEFIFASREERLKRLEKLNKELLEEVQKNKEQIDFLIKYETEEDFVADKLDSILTAHSNSSNKSNRVKAITEILKELKNSDLL